MSECTKCVFKDVSMWDMPCNRCKEGEGYDDTPSMDFFIPYSEQDCCIPGEFLPEKSTRLQGNVSMDREELKTLVVGLMNVASELLDALESSTRPECPDCDDIAGKVAEDIWFDESGEVEAGTFSKLGTSVGELVDEKNEAYGDSFSKCGEFLQLLYPDGVQPKQYVDMLGIVRIFDKQMRIATNPGAFEENPWQDIVGYGLLGMKNTRDRMEVENKDGVLDN